MAAGAWLRRVAARLRRDDGVAAVWILLTVPVVAVAVGFVLDTSTAVYGWNTAHDQAASAARAGAQQINLDLYRRTGTIELDPAAATQAAQAYLSTLGAAGTATATTTTVTVQVTRTTTEPDAQPGRGRLVHRARHRHRPPAAQRRRTGAVTGGAHRCVV